MQSLFDGALACDGSGSSVEFATQPSPRGLEHLRLGGRGTGWHEFVRAALTRLTVFTPQTSETSGCFAGFPLLRARQAISLYYLSAKHPRATRAGASTNGFATQRATRRASLDGSSGHGSGSTDGFSSHDSASTDGSKHAVRRTSNNGSLRHLSADRERTQR
jgi:hypothetical protein